MVGLGREFALVVFEVAFKGGGVLLREEGETGVGQAVFKGVAAGGGLAGGRRRARGALRVLLVCDSLCGVSFRFWEDRFPLPHPIGARQELRWGTRKLRRGGLAAGSTSDEA